MAWGAFLAAGASLLASSSASSSADKQSDLAEGELELMHQQAEIMNGIREQLLGYLPDALETQDYLFDYIMNQNDRNRQLAFDERQYSRDFVDRNFAMLGQEQDFEKYRVAQSDRLAAEERARQLQSIIDDEATASAERETALQELDYVRSIAAGERDFDVRQYQADQMTAQLEYQYRQQQYEQQVGVINRERQFEIDRQEDILRKAGILTDVIDEQISSFGDLVQPKRYSSEDVDEFTDEFYEGYLGDADRAADRLASVNEAGLIRSGVDISSTGDSSRRRLLQEQLVPLYETARIKARQDATQHVGNLQSAEIGGFNAEVGSRSAAIDEAIRGDQSFLEIMQALRNPSSARIDMNIGTGVTSPHNLTSAGQYQSPLAVTSGILNPRNVASGMDSTRALNTSRVVNPSTASAITNYQIPEYLRPTDLFSQATGVPSYNGSGNFNTLVQGAGSAGDAATQNFMDAIAQFSAMGNR